MVQSYHDPFDEILKQAMEYPNKRYQFYKEFLKLELVVIGTVKNNGNSSESEDIDLNLKYIEIENELVLPVFSCLEKFQVIFGNQYKYIKIPADMLLNMVNSEHPWVLNPGHGLSKKIIREELETLRDGKIIQYFFEQLTDLEKKKIMEDEIVEIPNEDMKLIIDCLNTVPQVKKAYLVNVYDPTSNKAPSPLIALELDSIERKKTIELIAALHYTINHQVSVQTKIEFMVLDEKIPITNSILERVKPFYVQNNKEYLESMFL